MLPQVAGHIFHHTSRAVAAAQNQAGHTLRNVLGLQTGTNPSSTSSLASWNNNTGSSSWGNGHAGAGGGAKFHTGSKFYSGFKQPSRSVAQANTSSTDTGVTYQDDTDESRPTLPQTVTQSTRVARKHRSRSQSFSLGSDAIATAERAKTFGVLQAVQQHARLHHAFVGSYRPQRVLEDAETTSRPPTPRLVRRNSTASTVSVSSLPDDISLSPPAPSTDPTDSAHPQSVLPPELRPKSPLHRRPATPASTAPTDSQLLDPFEVRAELLTLRQPNYESTVDDWNDVLDKLAAVRKHNEQPTEILQTYNDMVTRSIQPNGRTYATLINVLTARDEEVHWHIETISKRIENRHALDRSDDAENFVDQRRLEALRGEQNFPSALRLFRAVSASRAFYLPASLYIALLHSCARHQNVKAAIRLFSHIEKRGIFKPTASVYAKLLDVYMSVNDIEGARVVFDEFRKICSQGKIAWDKANPMSARAGHIRVWNSMINAYLRAANPGAALDLLGQMLDTEAGVEFGPKDVPAPAISTYIVIVRGFCLMGDPASAVSWFERLIDQGKHTEGEWTPTLEPPQPTVDFWVDVLKQLRELDRVDDINRLYARYAARLDGRSQIPIFMRHIVYFANIRYLQTHTVSEEQGVAFLDQALSALGPRAKWGSVLTFSDVNGRESIRELIGMYARFGNTDKAIDIIEQLSGIRAYWPVRPPHDPLGDVKPDLIHSVSDTVLFDKDILRPLPLLSVLRIVKAWAIRGMHVTQRLAQAVMSAFILAEERQDQLTGLTAQDWEALAFSVGTYGNPMTEDDNVLTLSLLTNMARFSVDPCHISEAVMHKLLRQVIDQKGIAETTALMEKLGPGFSALLHSPKAFTYVQPTGLPLPQSTPDAAPIEVGTMRIDDYHGRYIDELNMRRGKDDTAIAAFRRFEGGAALGNFPSPEVIGRLIEGLGRAGEMAKVDYLYGVAQNIISLLHGTKTAQLDGWAIVENSMIIARGHAGDGLSADAHRLRLLQRGLTPTADAYGALIQCVKDTTDDTARALEYFHESQARGVQPNVFLYNTTISKLAKARKADYALELFHKMKTSGVAPSSITYGAVIAACCRVGDNTSAETLFDEMTAQHNFRPRVPPYNTMMQFYVQTKPNRARFLHYYNRMISAGIKPTAHSYKLLLDCHGTIAPIDIKTMETTFAQLVNDKRVTVQGSHWAALINAHGCVDKDLNKAIAVFNSIEKHPSTLISRARLPDAVVFEALINVFVTLRRTDLVPTYLERLQQSGVHMTAYIANLLIRGYAAVGNIEDARKVFESLADPPVGVAAPHNHAPHDSSVPTRISPNELVYREPSTWEAMVRAELGNSNREHAISLIRRVQERQYPDSIVNRISGIMVDDAVSPWSSNPSSEVDNFPTSGSYTP